MYKKLQWIMLFFIIFMPLGPKENVLARPQNIQYISPLPGSIYNPPGTTIAIRFGDLLNPRSISGNLFSVVGSRSGEHAGKTVLADDQKTIIFKPDRPFNTGEEVQVDLRPGILSASGASHAAVSFRFSVSTTDPSSPQAIAAINKIIASEFPAVANNTNETSPVTPTYLTAPSDFPQIHVTTPATDVGDGYIFASNFIPNAFIGFPDPGAYLLILDNDGQPAYYQKVPETALATDFKVLSNGLLAYWENGAYYLLDNSYNEVKTIHATNGYYLVDVHDLLLLSNGDYMYLIYASNTIDMSKFVTGGDPNANVISAVIQEVDPDGNVVFQWNSLDHIGVSDTNQDLTAATIDYIHANAIEIANDSNVLLSGRHLDEITKIDHSTGDIIWRLGGKGNQFTISTAPGITDIAEFYYQHDVRQLPNGDITVFDNHNAHDAMNSRALEYSVDDVNMTATLVWEYRNTPDVNSGFMGDVQLLPNGNFMIGWGGVSSPNATEIKPDGTKVFEMGFDSPYVNYRSFRFPWHGYPTWAPALVLQTIGDTIRLTMSWNGATDIEKYNVYGGNRLDEMTLLAEVTKTGFENSVDLVSPQADYCNFLIIPIDLEDQGTRASPVVWNPNCPVTFMPFISN